MAERDGVWGVIELDFMSDGGQLLVGVHVFGFNLLAHATGPCWSSVGPGWIRGGYFLPMRYAQQVQSVARFERTQGKWVAR